MQVVINMPEEVLNSIKTFKGKFICENGYDLIQGIKDGTPLPKGHGALKDANDLLKMTESYKSELGRLKADPFVKSGIETVESFIKEIPTIIEADRSEEE